MVMLLNTNLPADVCAIITMTRQPVSGVFIRFGSIRGAFYREQHIRIIRIGDTLILGPMISTALICFSYGNNMVNLHRVRGALSTMERNHLAGIGIVQNARGNMSIAGISDILQISAQNIISGSGVAAKSLAMKPCAKQFRAIRRMIIGCLSCYR